MVWYTFGPFSAYDPTQDGAAKASTFTVYDENDNTNSTPLVTQNLFGLTVPVTSDSDGVVAAFRVENVPAVKIVAGSYSIPAYSVKDMRDAALAAQVAAEAAQAAAEAVQVDAASWDSITGKPGVFPPSQHVHSGADIATGTVDPARLTGVVKKVNGLSPDSSGNVNVSGGSGGGGVSSWNDLLDKPSTFPPSTHSHPASNISDSSSHGRGVLTGTTQAASRAAIAAGTSDVTVNGSTSGAAAPASHTHTAASVGLGNVQNLAPADLGISTATAAALDGKASTSHTHSTSQVTGLDAGLAARLQTVIVVTGSEARPSGSTTVLWVGGTTAPTNMASTDVHLREV